MKTTDRNLYFFYGGHLNPSSIFRCCTSPEFIGTAVLSGYALDFFGYTMRWDGAEESLVCAGGATTWGVLYEFSVGDAERLDAAQGVRLDGSGAYFHYPVDVKTPDGAVYGALAYVRNVLGEPMPPSREYLEYIAAGARNHGFPDDYIDNLLQRTSQPATFPVPRKSTLQELFSSESACCC